MFTKRFIKAMTVFGAGSVASSFTPEKTHPVYIDGIYSKTRMDSDFFKAHAGPESLPIRPPHHVSPVFEQSLAAWAEESTKKFQLLDFTPSDLAIEVAFLRLLGVERISLEDLGRERGSKGCFVSHLAVVEDAHPFIITSPNDVLDSIEELRADSHHRLKSLYSGVSDPVAHIKPSIVEKVTMSLSTHELENFYTIISHLSDDDMLELAHHLLEQDSEPHYVELLLENLKKARAACKEYIASLEHGMVQSISPRF